jgi:hypothetical protein
LTASPVRSNANAAPPPPAVPHIRKPNARNEIAPSTATLGSTQTRVRSQDRGQGYDLGI